MVPDGSDDDGDERGTEEKAPKEIRKGMCMIDVQQCEIKGPVPLTITTSNAWRDNDEGGRVKNECTTR